jgi:hypothetical protein
MVSSDDIAHWRASRMAKRRPPGAGGPKGRPGPAGLALSARHRRTLDAIFERPTRADIPWRDIERLFLALGGRVENGKGSRRRVLLRERRAVFHEPHPERVTDKGAVVDVRGFLESAGIRP